MKKYIYSIIAFTLMISIQCFAQSEFKIIYIDNSMPTREDGLNDLLYSKISESFAGLKTNNEGFVLYVSDGMNPSVTSYTDNLTKISDKILSANTALPNQFTDVEQLRDYVYEKLENFNGKIIFEFYIIGETAGTIVKGASPLFKLFPAEIAYAFNQKVEVIINCPASSLIPKPEDINSALEFYNTEFGQNNLSFKLITL